MILDRRLCSAANSIQDHQNWPEEAAPHYRCFARPRPRGKRTQTTTRGGPDDPEIRDRAFRQLDGTCGATAVHRARTLSGPVRLAVHYRTHPAFLATMPLNGVTGDVCGPRRATNPGGLRAAICQRAIPCHHQREPRMCLGRAHRHRLPAGHLHGMRLDTDWQPGARLTMALTDQWRLTGEVLAAEHPHRLSHTLDDPPGPPSVYVTREPRRNGDGTIIRLNVDKPWPPGQHRGPRKRLASRALRPGQAP
jgi:hypothetical protein